MAKRGRKPGLDPIKVKDILEALASNPGGLWLRQIAVQTGLHPSTISKYIEKALKPMIEEENLGGEEEKKPILRVIRLKPYVIEQLNQGKSVSSIYKIMKVLGENR
ncbi:hypothetical protein CL614_06400 [archaeon]|nr:hypothetical protein [archaeon]|tara:strand:- start:4014 stop:4331 length:318 start_codon:yes stop_codon:yes gene_type:complete